MSLGFEGKLIDDLKQSKDIWSMPVAMEIQDVWLNAPEKLATRIMSIAKRGSKEIRGPLWELFIWNSLNKVHKKVEYEPRKNDRKNNLDFHVTTHSGYEFIVEATVLGPNDEQLLSEIEDSEANRFERIREIFKGKVGQIQGTMETPVVLAFCNSFQRDFQTKFQKIQVLYGQPAIQYNFVTSEEKLVFSDKGFWHPDAREKRSFDAIYFGGGYLPGFSSFNLASTWLNPSSNDPLDVREFKLECDFYKSDETLYLTNSSRNFQWQATDIF